MNTGADFSSDGKYRFRLWRIWNDDKPLLCFIGLNPSTANSTTDDPTIRRLIRFTYDWGYGGFYMLNLFTFITPYPSELISHNGKTPLFVIRNTASKCDKLIFCWGNFKEASQRAELVSQSFQDAFCFGKNANGSPKHPLYLKQTTQIVKYSE